MEILSMSDGFARQFKRAASNGTKTQVYYATTRPRSHSTGSSYVRQCSGGKFGVKAFTNKERLVDEEKGRSGNRYKTELCRPYQEYGFCKYGDKCQFAHGEYDLREVPRHPKYKTELCRTYHAKGFCPYGPRCHFIHNLDEARKQDAVKPKSPKKVNGPSGNGTSLAFSLPISPSLDSGISSPAADGLQMGRSFEFPSSESSGSDDDYEQQAMYLLARSAYSPLGGSGEHGFNQRNQLGSPDPFAEFDALSTGSGSPMKPLSDGFVSGSDHDLDLCDLFVGMGLKENAPPSSTTIAAAPGYGRDHLPVFGDMINSKSDTALVGRQRAV